MASCVSYFYLLVFSPKNSQMAFTKSRIQCYKGTTNCYLHNILTSLRQPNVIKDLVKLKCFSQFDCLKKFDNQSYHNVIFLPFSKKSIKASVGCEHIPSTLPENRHIIITINTTTTTTRWLRGLLVFIHEAKTWS